MLKIINEEKITISPDNDNPFLQGLFKPNAREYDADTDTLEVIGTIPNDLWGVYARNTHNQVHEPIGIYHPFDGDGMIHSAYFCDGKMQYRNRFVHTTGFLAEKAAGRALWPGVLEPERFSYRGWGAMGAMKDNAGTDVIYHNGSLLVTMSQGSEPWRMDPVTLENLGPDPVLAKAVGYAGIAGEFKVDYRSNEMVFQNYPEEPPSINVGTVDSNGNLASYRSIKFDFPRWPHDLGMTENYLIVHDLPLYFDPDLRKQGQRKLQFYPDKPSRFGVFSRSDQRSDIQWFEAKSCFILHTANYYEDGDEIIMDGCVSFEPQGPGVGEHSENPYERIMAHLDKHRTKTRLYRWRFNLKNGTTIEGFIDQEICEFPVCRNDCKGYPYRYIYASLFEAGTWNMNGIKKFDLQTGVHTRYEYGEGRYGGEVHFAPRINSQFEDDGYLIVFIQDLVLDRSEAAIFDAQALANGPLCQIILPERIQSGTHACWVEGERLKRTHPI